MTGTEIALLIAVFAVIAGVAIVALWQIRGLRAQLARSQATLAGLATDLQAAPTELKSVLGDATRHIIAIEILNPMELAASQSKLARNLGAVVPEVVRAEVTKRTVLELTEQLAANGVQAQVQVHESR